MRSPAVAAALLCIGGAAGGGAMAMGGCQQEREGDGAAPATPTVHAPGILDPDHPEFHGALLSSRGWDFPLCARCHGDDFEGGPLGPSCTGCHPRGPTACETCHGETPTTGAHERHVRGGPLGKRFRCRACHVEPRRWDDPGHLRRADGSVDPPPAEVDLSAAWPRAAESSGGPVAPPSFDRDTGRCSGVYCHGATLEDAGGVVTEPRWAVVGLGEAACGLGCHAVPPPSHGLHTLRCPDCHGPSPGPSGEDLPFDPRGYDPERQRKEHVDGELDLL